MSEVELYHISDLHIHGSKAKNAEVEENLQILKKQVNERDGYAVIATGDIVDDGAEEQYEEALRLLKPFSGRIILVPGNHDVGWIGNFYNSYSSKRFNRLAAELNKESKSKFCINYSLSDFRIFIVDTTRRLHRDLAFAQGKIGRIQMSKIKRFLKRNKKEDVKTVVCLHHDPFYREWPLRLMDADRLLKVVSGKTDYLLCGHSHQDRQWYFGPTPEQATYFSSVKPMYEDQEFKPLPCLKN